MPASLFGMPLGILGLAVAPILFVGANLFIAYLALASLHLLVRGRLLQTLAS